MQRNLCTRLIYALLLLPLLAACTSDEEASGTDEGTPIEIGLAIAIDDGGSSSASSSRLSRSTWSYGEDYDYAEGEGLYSWFVVMLNADNEVEYVFTSDKGEANTFKSVDGTAAPNGLDNLKEDRVNYDNITIPDGATDHPLYVYTTTGDKTFFNFANISQEEVLDAAGLDADAFTKGKTLDVAKLEAATYAINGNEYKPLERTDALKGIPMSGKQELNINWGDHFHNTVTLWVVRMLAKLTFRVTNATSHDFTLNSVTLSHITQNPTDGTKNIKLLPSVTTPDVDATQTPNLATTATEGDYTYSVGGTTISANSAETVELSFYVNESQIPTDDPYQEFMLTLNLERTDGTTEAQRYTLIADNDAGEWKFIARNDRRVIPIKLQEYKLTITPYDYPPIAVLPSSVYEKDSTYFATFHASGDFHLIPSVSAYDGTELTNVAFSNVTWTNVYYPANMYAPEHDRHDVGGSQVSAGEEVESGIPVWYATGGYIHGTLADDISTNYASGCSSRHRLRLSIASEQYATRTLEYPVVIHYVP